VRTAELEQQVTTAREEADQLQDQVSELQVELRALTVELQQCRSEAEEERLMREEESQERALAEMKCAAAEEQLSMSRRQNSATGDQLRKELQDTQMRMAELEQQLEKEALERRRTEEDSASMRTATMGAEVEVARLQRAAKDHTDWRKMAAEVLASRTGLSVERTMLAMSDTQGFEGLLDKLAPVPTEGLLDKLAPVPTESSKPASQSSKAADHESNANQPRDWRDQAVQLHQAEQRAQTGGEVSRPAHPPQAEAEELSLVEEQRRLQSAVDDEGDQEEAAVAAAGSSCPPTDQEEVFWLGVDAVASDLLQQREGSSEAMAQWEFKWAPDSDELHGPYDSEEIMAWADEGYFAEGLWMRRWYDGPNTATFIQWTDESPR